MRLNEIRYAGADPVEGYGPGFFRVAGQVISGAMLISAGGARTWGGYDDSAPLVELAGAVDVLILGTGAEIAHIPAALRAVLDEAGVGVELMSSPTGARTYNVLLSEGRRIAAALLPV